jgi:hypothetical protein
MIIYNQFLAFFVFACLETLLYLLPLFEADSFQPLLWIRISGQFLKSQKVEFLHKKIYFQYVISIKTDIRRCKILYERQETKFIFVNFGQFTYYRIGIPHADPEQPNECGSGFTTLSLTLLQNPEINK